MDIVRLTGQFSLEAMVLYAVVISLATSILYQIAYPANQYRVDRYGRVGYLMFYFFVTFLEPIFFSNRMIDPLTRVQYYCGLLLFSIASFALGAMISAVYTYKTEKRPINNSFRYTAQLKIILTMGIVILSSALYREIGIVTSMFALFIGGYMERYDRGMLNRLIMTPLR